MADTDITGFAARLGAHDPTTGNGEARLRFDATEEHLNPAGTVHGGVLATLVDTAMGLAVRSTREDGDVPATSQLTVTYLEPGGAGPLEISARVRTSGEHLTVCEADVTQAGATLVHALATFAVLHR